MAYTRITPFQPAHYQWAINHLRWEAENHPIWLAQYLTNHPRIAQSITGRPWYQQYVQSHPSLSKYVPSPATAPAAAPTKTHTSPAPKAGGLTTDQANAYNLIRSALQADGLDSLAPKVLQYVQKGYDANSINYFLQQTPEWKQRFAGNELRKKAGLPELDVSTYLDLENQYASVLKQFGIPQGMFGRADFADWIGKDVSPSEIQGRVQMASNAATSADPYYKQALAQMGVDTGHLTAYYLDQKRALPFLQRQEAASAIGSEALRQHLNLNPETALALASMGVTQNEAHQGYSQVAQELPRMKQLAQITPGANFNQSEAEQQVLFGNAQAIQNAFHLTTTEAARFSGSSGLGTNIYHPAYGLNEPLEGQY